MQSLTCWEGSRRVQPAGLPAIVRTGAAGRTGLRDLAVGQHNGEGPHVVPHGTVPHCVRPGCTASRACRDTGAGCKQAGPVQGLTASRKVAARAGIPSEGGHPALTAWQPCPPTWHLLLDPPAWQPNASTITQAVPRLRSGGAGRGAGAGARQLLWAGCSHAGRAANAWRAPRQCTGKKSPVSCRC